MLCVLLCLASCLWYWFISLYTSAMLWLLLYSCGICEFIIVCYLVNCIQIAFVELFYYWFVFYAALWCCSWMWKLPKRPYLKVQINIFILAFWVLIIIILIFFKCFIKNVGFRITDESLLQESTLGKYLNRIYVIYLFKQYYSLCDIEFCFEKHTLGCVEGNLRSVSVEY